MSNEGIHRANKAKSPSKTNLTIMILKKYSSHYEVVHLVMRAADKLNIMVGDPDGPKTNTSSKNVLA